MTDDEKHKIIVEAGYQLLRRAHAAYESGQIRGYRCITSGKYLGAIDTIVKTAAPNDADYAKLLWPAAFEQG